MVFRVGFDNTNFTISIPFIVVWSTLAQNSILVGQVDAFCLACERHLRDEPSAAAHAREPAHAANLRAVGYFDKYKDDCIRKVKGGYFCGMCNTVLGTAARAGLHVREPAHGAARGALLLRRAGGAAGAGGGVLARGAVLLPRAAWHGLVGDACLLCNAEFLAEDAHTADHKHLLNLVQSTALFGPGNSVYRKIDGNSYQCLTCNNVFAAASFDEHFEGTDHKTALKQCAITEENYVSDDEPKTTERSIDHNIRNCEPVALHLDSKLHDKFKLQIEDNKEEAENENDFKSNFAANKYMENTAGTKKTEQVKGKTQEGSQPEGTDNRSQILESVSTFQKNKVNINFINDTAFCKKCTMNIEFDFKAINEHIDLHKKTTNKIEDTKVHFQHGVQANGGKKNLLKNPVLVTQNGEHISTTSLQDIMAVAKKNGMMNNGRELHCSKCDAVVQVSIKSIEEHISGSRHKAKMMPQVVVKQEPKDNICKQLLEDFLRHIQIFDEDNCKEFVINEKYCISHASLMFVSKTLNELTCLVCSIKLTSTAILIEHSNDPRHLKISEECCVITSLASEFVREIRPGVYHCGFCNVVAGNWKSLEKHLDTSAHKRCKARAGRRLQKHMSDVRANKTKPGVYNCSFCKYVANDWDTLNRHFDTPDHVRTKAREEQRLRELVEAMPNRIREETECAIFEMFKNTSGCNPNSDSD